MITPSQQCTVKTAKSAMVMMPPMPVAQAIRFDMNSPLHNKTEDPNDHGVRPRFRSGIK